MSSATIAVIEDESIIAAAVAARLRREGFKVEIAADGPSGVELCERTRPDLVVLDVMLPGFDGLEVCRRIQKERPVPVIMLTARDSETDLLVGLGIGADDYVEQLHGIGHRAGHRAGDVRREVEGHDPSA
jgi:DNA-binding response OmpR family regulator